MAGLFSICIFWISQACLHLNHCVGFDNVAHFDIIEIGDVQTT